MTAIVDIREHVREGKARRVAVHFGLKLIRLWQADDTFHLVDRIQLGTPQRLTLAEVERALLERAEELQLTGG